MGVTAYYSNWESFGIAKEEVREYEQVIYYSIIIIVRQKADFRFVNEIFNCWGQILEDYKCNRKGSFIVVK